MNQNNPDLQNPVTSSPPYKIVTQGQEDVMRIDYSAVPYTPSIEDNELVMMDVVDKLVANPNIASLSFIQRRFYNYNFEQTRLLQEIADIYSYLTKRKKLMSYSAVGSSFEYPEVLNERHSALRYIIYNVLRTDPIGTYVELKRLIRTENIKQKRALDPREKESRNIYLETLNEILKQIEETRIIDLAKPYLAGYQLGDRSVYKIIFRPLISPDFMFTKLMARCPLNGKEIDIYSIDKNTEVTIFSVPEDIKYLYHLNPPEFKLPEDHYSLINQARGVFSKHQPREEQFLDPQKMRLTFTNIGRDLLRELADAQGIDVSIRDIKNLTEILLRHTIGFGFIEILLKDTNVQDITVNSPNGEVPIFLLHGEYDNCTTNITPARDDVESWATKFRLLSGRPLDEANPILDTNLHLPHARSRVSIITRPLNPFGYAYSFRRHRDKPWTLPLFCKAKMINPLAAGLMSFLIDGSRTMLVAGTRSSGKTSLLGSLLVEIMRKYRIITIEDTLELPGEALRKLGYDIQSIQVRSALTSGGTEMSASEGIRTSLRLGDSSLIVGEVRSKEAVALYEAMRIGALANVVAGTIHADSAYGVFDRVVNDLGVPKTSFKATDIVYVANPLKSPDGLHKWRRVTQITEVRKTWEDDPLLENGFVDLMKYNPHNDQLEVTPELINGDSEVLKGIGGNVKEWAGDWDALWENIQLRADLKKLLIEYSERAKNDKLLEAPFNIRSNDQFHKISEEIRSEVGSMESKRIKYEWEEWLKKTIRKGDVPK